MRYRDRFDALVEDEFKALAEARLPNFTSVDMFLSSDRDPQARHRDVQRAYDELMQTLLTGKNLDGTTIYYLGLPESPEKSQFHALLNDVLSETQWQEYTSRHEIVLMCEQRFNAGNLLFATWDQCGPKMGLQDKFLFSRTDYSWFTGFSGSANKVNRTSELLAESVS
jgi:hypothetical protein